MSRQARERSYTQVYHIILRGINKQDIFYDRQDRIKFITELENTKEKYNYLIYAYCLMPNHVHIMLKDTEDSLEYIMKSLSVRYSNYFNKKYERVGHLFQNRFLSKVVENDNYVLDLQRYIHQNPIKAGISTIEYEWSSYLDYTKRKGITDIEYVMSLFENDKNEFKKCNSIMKYSINMVFELEMNRKISDEELGKVIKEILNLDNLHEIQRYNKKHRDEILYKLGEIKGIDCKQVSRILGINIRTVERGIKIKKRPSSDKIVAEEASPKRQGGSYGEG